MAYDIDDFRIVVAGDLAGSEVWANTWSVTGTGTPQSLSDAFHAFYTGIFDACANTSVAASFTLTQRVGNVPISATWSPIPGDDSVNPALPNEVALRVSLSGDNGVQGGPFLCGFSSAVLNDSGNLDSTIRTGFIGALTSLRDDLAAADWALAINKATTAVHVAVDTARLGSVFDVIRRRRNRLSESYVSVNF